jgi:hypothetical protein
MDFTSMPKPEKGHCEEQSDEAISPEVASSPKGLLRFARNDRVNAFSKQVTTASA